ncbi:MAG: response regulator transcription factor [Clostridiaceae bacterium]|nr:response regulator transcription factor [Clostridiaceae bacterium]
MKTTILIADGQKETLNTLRLHLEKEGYRVLEAQNGSDTLELLYLHRIDLAILDISLPGTGGSFLIKKMRETSDFPILFLSSSDGTDELRQAFRLGADDFISKPFVPFELMNRVKGHLRRMRQFSDAKRSDSGIYRYGSLQINTDDCEVTKDGVTLALDPTEYKILRHLMENPGTSFDHHRLYEVGWNDTRFVDDTTIEGTLLQIRFKLGDPEGSYIRISDSRYSFSVDPPPSETDADRIDTPPGNL